MTSYLRPDPFVCYHPRARWIAEGSGYYSTDGSGYTLTGYRCGICWMWIAPDAEPWPTNKEVMERLERDLVKYADAFDRLADQ